VSSTAPLSPVVNYHGLARRHLMPSGFLMRPLLNGGTLARLQRLGSLSGRDEIEVQIVRAA